MAAFLDRETRVLILQPNAIPPTPAPASFDRRDPPPIPTHTSSPGALPGGACTSHSARSACVFLPSGSDGMLVTLFRADACSTARSGTSIPGATAAHGMQNSERLLVVSWCCISGDFTGIVPTLSLPRASLAVLPCGQGQSLMVTRW